MEKNFYLKVNKDDEKFINSPKQYFLSKEAFSRHTSHDSFTSLTSGT